MTDHNHQSADQDIEWTSADNADVRSDSTSFVIWFTGLSGAGKLTIAMIVKEKLRLRELPTYSIDGGIVRLGLKRDLGFGGADRVESIRRISEVARILVDAGQVVLVATISPFREGRKLARELFAPETFVEVHVDTPIEVAEQRDTKGLYRMAREGRLHNFTGIDLPYEVPVDPEIRIDAVANSPDEAGELVLRVLEKMEFI